jgi:2-polyprenyl-6-methoxyphenol hydroxylase-like FAD-dependent oxidoreductase
MNPKLTKAQCSAKQQAGVELQASRRTHRGPTRSSPLGLSARPAGQVTPASAFETEWRQDGLDRGTLHRQRGIPSACHFRLRTLSLFHSSVVQRTVVCGGSLSRKPFELGQRNQGMSKIDRPSVLISGVGIAGPALAYWLLRAGLTPTLVERAHAPRTGGYIIDFWGAGYDIVERMDLLPDVLAAGYTVRQLRIVDRRGRRVGGFDARAFAAAARGRFTSLPRGALSAILYRSIEGRVDTLFGNSVSALQQEGDGVLVQFERGPARRFDLVIGADGVHSAVRRLAFGPEGHYEHAIGYTAAAFEAAGYQPRDTETYIVFGAPGRQVGRFSMRGDRTVFLLVAADRQALDVASLDGPEQRAYLTARFAHLGWECREIIARLSDCDQLYFDRVSQIRMSSWSTGRVALVGDAAWAPSLLAGQGSALAIIGAYVLAGEVASGGPLEAALARYEARLRPFMTRKQLAAASFAKTFAPKTRLGLAMRNQLSRVLSIPSLAKAALAPSLRDRIHIPQYAALEAAPTCAELPAGFTEDVHP